MASKKLLYRHVNEKVVKKRTRRPLAQGRLVTEAPQTHLVFTGARVPQGQAAYGQISHVDCTDREDLNATPRKNAPRATEHQSPRHSPPAENLDLSDTETDDNTLFQPQHGSPEAGMPAFVKQVPHCLVLDASADGPSPSMVVTYERAPVTIISHGQQATSKQSPNVSGGQGFSHWKVDVDQVPKVEAKSPRSGVRKILPLPLVKVRPSGTAESEEDDVETLVSQASKRERSTTSPKKSTPRMPQPDFDASSESERGGLGGVSRKPAEPADLASDSDTCSLFEYVPKAKSKPASQDSTLLAQPPKSERKKKGERIVPSRYLQSAMSKKNSSGSLDKTAKKGLSVQVSSQDANQRGRGPTPSSGAKSKKPEGSGSTPRARSVGKEKTSTPTHDQVPYMQMMSCDASAINPELSLVSFDVGHVKHSSSTEQSQSPFKQKRMDPKVQKMRLDLQYARYLQWLYLDSRARQVLRQQEKEAMKQMHQVWALVESQREKAHELQKDVDRLHHLNMVDEQLNVQKAALEPFIQAVPRMKKGYVEMATALDTTRHQVPTRGIFIPEDEDHFLDCLQEVLLESEQLLVELSRLTKSDSSAIHEFSSALQAIEKAVDGECQELNRCAEMLSAVRSLATHENSLRIQAMQTKPHSGLM